MTNGRHGRTVVLVIAIALTLSACAWGQAGGNAARNGANPYEPGLTTANVSQLQLAWQADNATGSDHEPVMNAKYLYTATSPGFVNAYAAGGPASAEGSTRCSGTPSVCTPVWFSRVTTTAVTSSPVVDGENLFVSAAVDGRWNLYALDADPANCPDTAFGCVPVWTGRWGAPIRPQAQPSAVVADGRVYLAAPTEIDGHTATLAVFDEMGLDHCTAGPPRTCTPIFESEIPTAFSGPPTISVAAGRVFVQAVDGTRVFDAAGQAGCSNGTCSPLYRLATGAARGVSLYGTTAFAAAGTSLMAFDATGATGCSGSPVVCQPKWTAALGAQTQGDLPTISNGTVLVAESGNPTDPGLEAFDAGGARGCTGSPAVCQALWGVSDGLMAGDSNHLAATPTLVVMSGWSIIPFNPPMLRQTIKTFDLAGVSSCNLTPVRCNPLSTTSVGTDIGISNPAVAFGRIAVSDSSGHLKVFTVAGS